MTVQLPSSPRAQSAKPRFLDFGSVSEGSLGGPDQRLSRLGSRWQVDYQLPPMKAAEAQVWVARLVRGMHEKARMYFPQPGYPVAAGETTAVQAGALANSFSISLGDQVARFEGQFFSAIHSGKRYVHQVTGYNPGATPVIGIMPALRVPLSVADVLEFGTPMIEGFVSGPAEGWDIDAAKVYGLSFSIREAE